MIKKIGKTITRAKKKLERVLLKKKLQALITKTLPIPVATASEKVICMLCGHSMVHEGVCTLKSFLRYVNKDFEVMLFDDGTLNRNDINFLNAHLPGIKIISKAQADATSGAYLKTNGFENCINVRNEHPLRRKIFDFVIFNQNKQILQLDSDILFLQKPTALLEKINEKRGIIYYNIDRGPAFSFKIEDLEEHLGKSLPIKFNSGLVLYYADISIFNSIEDFMAKEYVPTNNWTRGQTLFCLGIAKNYECLPLPDDYDVSFKIGESNRHVLVAEHYCAWSRTIFYVDFIEKVYPFLKKENNVSQYYLDIITRKITP